MFKEDKKIGLADRTTTVKIGWKITSGFARPLVGEECEEVGRADAFSMLNTQDKKTGCQVGTR